MNELNALVAELLQGYADEADGYIADTDWGSHADSAKRELCNKIMAFADRFRALGVDVDGAALAAVAHINYED